MKKMTVKNILSRMPKLEVAPVSDKEARGYINDAIEYWFSLCYCGKKCKNVHGLNIHRAKMHPLEYKYMKIELLKLKNGFTSP